MSKAHPHKSSSYARKIQRRSERQEARNFVNCTRDFMNKNMPNVEDSELLRKRIQNFRNRVKKVMEDKEPGTGHESLDEAMRHCFKQVRQKWVKI